MSQKDHIHYLAVDVLDVAVRCHFTQSGLGEVEAMLRAHLEPKTFTAPAVENVSAVNVSKPVETTPAPVAAKKTRTVKAPKA